MTKLAGVLGASDQLFFYAVATKAAGVLAGVLGASDQLGLRCGDLLLPWSHCLHKNIAAICPPTSGTLQGSSSS